MCVHTVATWRIETPTPLRTSYRQQGWPGQGLRRATGRGCPLGSESPAARKPRSRGTLVPAECHVNSNTDPSLPPMGLRVRLKASVDISHFDPKVQVLLVAL